MRTVAIVFTIALGVGVGQWLYVLSALAVRRAMQPVIERRVREAQMEAYKQMLASLGVDAEPVPEDDGHDSPYL